MEVLVFWDGISHGTRYVMENCSKRSIPMQVYTPQGETHGLVCLNTPNSRTEPPPGHRPSRR